MRLRLLLATVALALVEVAPAPAAEYGLRVANVYDSAFFAYLDGAIGRGEGEASLERLGGSLDAGTVPPGALLFDRPVAVVSNGVATAFGAVPVRGDVLWEGRPQWLEARWQSDPGRRVVWAIARTRFEAPEVRNVALQGRGGRLRHFIPYRAAIGGGKGLALSYPLEFVRHFEGRPALWERYLSGAVDLRDGLAVVVGVNPDRHWADYVYIVIDPASAPATFSVVVAWGERGGPGGPGVPAASPVAPAR